MLLRKLENALDNADEQFNKIRKIIYDLNKKFKEIAIIKIQSQHKLISSISKH